MTEEETFRMDFPDAPFKVIKKIGQGTFSSVFKAVDLNHSDVYNSINYRRTNLDGCGLVALKRIHPTSSPSRIAAELSCLDRLSDHPNIAPLISAFRNEDKVVAVLPYFPFDSFKHLLDMDRKQIQTYFKCLLSALDYMHGKGLIHRDIKPSNFLFSLEANTGVLVDFGLTQRDPRFRPMFKKPTATQPEKPVVKARIGYIQNDTRPVLRAERAGTRGFRAPEVLFRVTSQTTAIDIWSVGVILLSIVTNQYPFFQSNTDADALLEIAGVFGKKEIKKLAAKLGRSFETNLPCLEGYSFEYLAEKLNPGFCEMAGDDVMLLLRDLLTLDHKQRPTAKDLLQRRLFEEE